MCFSQIKGLYFCIIFRVSRQKHPSKYIEIQCSKCGKKQVRLASASQTQDHFFCGNKCKNEFYKGKKKEGYTIWKD